MRVQDVLLVGVVLTAAAPGGVRGAVSATHGRAPGRARDAEYEIAPNAISTSPGAPKLWAVLRHSDAQTPLRVFQ